MATDPPPNPDDLDGDDIPNDWEVQFHHDPDNAAGASADFDNDGPAALQEYQLLISTAGVSGNPLGIWARETIDSPADMGIDNLNPVDINNRSGILVNGVIQTNGNYHAVGYTWTLPMAMKLLF